jgi:hypothetical protein
MKSKEILKKIYIYTGAIKIRENAEMSAITKKA